MKEISSKHAIRIEFPFISARDFTNGSRATEGSREHISSFRFNIRCVKIWSGKRDLNSLRSNGRHSVAAPLRGRIDTTTLFWIFLMCENLERETDLNSLRSNDRHSVAAPLRGRIDTTTLFWIFLMYENLERETRFELATPTLARSCSTN